MRASSITKQAIVAAIYAVLCIALAPFAFSVIQFRVAEMLMILPFYDKRYTIGLTAGCFLANLFSPLGIVDVIFGTLSTLIACVIIARLKKRWLVPVCAAVVMAAIIPFELYFVLNEPFWLSVFSVSLSECVMVAVGTTVFAVFENTPLKRVLLRKE